MPLQSEFPAYFAQVYSALSGESAITSIVSDRIYPGAAPDNADHPFVVYYLMTGGPTNMTPRPDSDQRFTVSAWASGLGGYLQANTLFSAIYELLHNNASLSVSGWSLYRCQCIEGSVRYIMEYDNSIQYHRVEGDFRLTASKD